MEKYAVLKKVKIVRNFKRPGYIGVDRKGKYYLFDKHEKNNNYFNKGDIIWVYVTKDHPEYSYIKLTMNSVSIEGFANSLKGMTHSELVKTLQDEDIIRFINDIYNHDIGFINYLEVDGTLAEACPGIIDLYDTDIVSEYTEWLSEAAQILSYLYMKIVEGKTWEKPERN